MRKIQLLMSTLLLFLLLVACAPTADPVLPPQAPAPAPAAPAPAAAVPAAPAKPAWEMEWEKTLAAAKKEGKVVVSVTVGPEVRRALAEAFKSTFGIGSEFLGGESTLLAARIASERRARIYSVDAGVMGTSSPYTLLKPLDALERLDKELFLPELTDPQEIQKVWRDEKLGWVDNDHTMLSFAPYLNLPVTINTQLVKPEEIKGYRDLLNTKWKGRIAMFDPTISRGMSWAQPVGMYIMGWDYMRKLAAQEPFITRDTRLLIEWVARGKYAVGISIRGEEVKTFIDLGAPVQLLYPEEGTYTTTSSSVAILLKGAPHPNAGKLFINWLLSKEGQTVYSKAFRVPSARLDVSTEGIDPSIIPSPKARYFTFSDEEMLLKRAETEKIVRDIFGLK